jgi:hypothetical protein
MDRPLAAAATLALGFVLAALVFGLFFYNARSTRDTVQVTGAATQHFEADVAKWRLSLAHPAPLDGLAAGYETMSGSVGQLRAQLRALGVADSAITVQPPMANPRYDQSGQVTGYEVQQSLYVVSSGVDALEGLALNPGRLQLGAAVLQGSHIEYYYDDLATLKHSLLAAATADARRRAEEIVERSGTGIGKMVAARAGVFQITEPYSTEVADFGMHNTATRRQQITVTVHATFTLD